MAASLPLSPSFFCTWCHQELLDQQAVKKHKCPFPQSQSKQVISIFCTCCGNTFRSRNDLATHVNVQGFKERPTAYLFKTRRTTVDPADTPTQPVARPPAPPSPVDPAPLIPFHPASPSSPLFDDTQSSTMDNRLPSTPFVSPILQSPLSPILHPDPLLSVTDTNSDDLSDFLQSQPLESISTLGPLTQKTPVVTSPPPSRLTFTAPTTSTSSASPSIGHTSTPQPSLVYTLYNELAEMRQRAEAANSLIRSLAILALFLSHTLRHQTNLQLIHSHSEFVLLLQSSSIWPPAHSSASTYSDFATVLPLLITILHQIINAPDPTQWQ